MFNTSDYYNLTSWPTNRVTELPYFFGGRGTRQFGTLGQPGGGSVVPDNIHFNTSTGISNGIPILSDDINWLIPETNNLATSSTAGAIVFVSPPLTAAAQICGIPTVSLSFIPNNDTWQIYGMLYDVDDLDIGTIISDMFYTNYGTGRPNNQTVTLSTSFHMLCREVSVGRRLGVGLTLYNELYTTASQKLSVAVNYGNGSWISLPLFR